MNLSEACMPYLKEEHVCPHCNTKMACCHVPPFHIGDGLGWGTEIFFVCLNDECQLYANGWKHIEEQYGQVASYRYMELPGETKGTPMMVGGREAFTGSIIDPDAAYEKSERYKKEQQAVAQLDTCIEDNNLAPLLTLITDELANLESRHRAVELLEELGDLSCIDPIRNHKFKHTEIGQLADVAIRNMLKKAFKKECYYCAEIIKLQAKVCQHCGKEDPHLSK